MQDPPRLEAHDAVERCQRAGIRTVMITGDHPDTARAIARELGILQPGDALLDGRALEAMSDDELRRRVREVSVYARVTAEHKLRIVRAWKADGAVVAMTGDGVNDAPALKEASVGIAMGFTGTEVTKEAADLVITDDNFASIVAAVEEGRGIYDNIVKTLGYLLAGNTAELAVMLVAAILGWPLPLLPIQLLWINLVTDGLPALGLATDPVDDAVLARPPRRPDAELMDRSFLVNVTLTGALIAAVTLGVFGWEMAAGAAVADARNAGFAVLVLAQLLRAFGARSDASTIWEIGLLSNLRLLGIVAVTFTLQLVIHDVEALQPYFGTKPVSLVQMLVWTALASIPLLVLDLVKLVRRSRFAPPARQRGGVLSMPAGGAP
jgi:Ca2+-transporting ATPase